LNSISQLPLPSLSPSSSSLSNRILGAKTASDYLSSGTADNSRLPEETMVEVRQPEKEFFISQFKILSEKKHAYRLTIIIMLDSKLANPKLWVNAYEHASSISPGRRIKPAVIDLYLTKSWYQSIRNKNLTDRHSYYLDMNTVTQIFHNTLNHTIQKILLLPEDAAIPKRPILFSPQYIGEDENYRMVLFDYVKKEVFVFHHDMPQETDMYASWDEWKGCDLWKSIANVFGWNLDLEWEESSPKVIEPSWIKVDFLLILMDITF
jgi:hypothetical protein